MRGAIRHLSSPRDDISEKEQLEHTKKCLLKIGDHINQCIVEYKDNQDLLKKWRG